MRSQAPIIIKRQVRRSAHRESGGGAWKVAFADFTMAMMSLFLVLWLLAVTEEHDRRIVASSLRSYSVFDKTGNPFALSDNSSYVDMEGQPRVIEQVAAKLLDDAKVKEAIKKAAPDNKLDMNKEEAEKRLDKILDGDFQSEEQMQLLASIVKAMAGQLTAANNLNVDVVPQGLRITIQDDEHQQMFKRGSVTMSPFFEDLLMALAPVFKHVRNKVVISGHTDSVPYQGSQYSNWELSGDRALMARRALEAGGMPKTRVIQVIAMSDRFPVDMVDTKASKNRRIEILLLNNKARGELTEMFDRDVAGNVIDQAAKEAENNRPVTR